MNLFTVSHVGNNEVVKFAESREDAVAACGRMNGRRKPTKSKYEVIELVVPEDPLRAYRRAQDLVPKAAHIAFVATVREQFAAYPNLVSVRWEQFIDETGFPLKYPLRDVILVVSPKFRAGKLNQAERERLETEVKQRVARFTGAIDGKDLLDLVGDDFTVTVHRDGRIVTKRK